MRGQDAQLTPVRSIDDIPAFVSEAAEREFWDTHYLADEFWETAPRPKESIVERARRKASAPRSTRE